GHAGRLNPLAASFPANDVRFIAYFGVGNHEAVVDATARVLLEHPNSGPALRYRGASLALLGRIEEARKVVGRLIATRPGYCIAEVRRHYEFDLNSPFNKPGVTESLYRGLRLGGGREGPMEGRGRADEVRLQRCRIPVDILVQCHVLDVPTLTGAFGNVFIIRASNRSLVRWRAQQCSNRGAVARL